MSAREPNSGLGPPNGAAPDGLLAASEAKRQKTRYRLIGVAFTVVAVASLALMVTGVVAVGTGRHGTVSGNLLGTVALLGFLQGPYMTITGNKPLNRDYHYWDRKRQQRTQQPRVQLPPPPPPIYYNAPETPHSAWRPQPEQQQYPNPPYPNPPYPPQQG